MIVYCLLGWFLLFSFFGPSTFWLHLMDSSFVRMTLFTLGGYALIALILFCYEWYRDEFPSPPSGPPNLERIQHPYHHGHAVKALEWFSRLPGTERKAFLDSLASSFMPVEQWMSRIGHSDLEVMCLGESHMEATRSFLAEKLFPHMSVDTLLLEATPQELNRIFKKMNAGRTHFPLLDADILGILRSCTAKNPDIEVSGIEETEAQLKYHAGDSWTRDQSIAQNFWNSYRPGKKNIVLFGAFHCSNDRGWLFHKLKIQASPELQEKMLNVRVLEEHHSGPLEAFMYFLDEVGLRQKSFVIPDTGSLHPQISILFHSLSRQVLDKFQAVIVFRLQPHRHIDPADDEGAQTTG